MLVIAFMGVSALTIIVGALMLSYWGKPIPEPIWGLGGAALGSLGTLLTGHRISDFSGPTRATDVADAVAAVAKIQST